MFPWQRCLPLTQSPTSLAYLCLLKHMISFYKFRVCCRILTQGLTQIHGIILGAVLPSLPRKFIASSKVSVEHTQCSNEFGDLHVSAITKYFSGSLFRTEYPQYPKKKKHAPAFLQLCALPWKFRRNKKASVPALLFCQGFLEQSWNSDWWLCWAHPELRKL